MAMIICPECGKSVSDKAETCPNCGYPIAASNLDGTVKIKNSILKAPTGLNGKQKVSIVSTATEKLLWEGFSGEVAELHFNEATSITVTYHKSWMHWGGECTGIVDPKKSSKYNISATQGVFETLLVLQPVDYFDAD